MQLKNARLSGKYYYTYLGKKPKKKEDKTTPASEALKAKQE